MGSKKSKSKKKKTNAGEDNAGEDVDISDDSSDMDSDVSLTFQTRFECCPFFFYLINCNRFKPESFLKGYRH